MDNAGAIIVCFVPGQVGILPSLRNEIKVDINCPIDHEIYRSICMKARLCDVLLKIELATS